MAHVLGVDPGATGALVLVHASRAGEERVVRLWDMPVETVRVNGKDRKRVSPRAVSAIMHSIAGGTAIPTVCIEHVHGYGRDGAVGAFSFGRAFGIVEAVAHACGLRVELVAPAKWKGALNLGASKAVSRRRAKMLFPESSHLFERVKDDGRAEAALIAYWQLQQGFDRPMVTW